jgi:glutaredoxin 2
MYQPTTEEKQELIDSLKDVQTKFAEAWEELNDIVQALDDKHAQAYLVEQLQVLIFKDHGFMGRSMSIEKYADDLQDELLNPEDEEEYIMEIYKQDEE